MPGVTGADRADRVTGVAQAAGATEVAEIAELATGYLLGIILYICTFSYSFLTNSFYALTLVTFITFTFLYDSVTFYII